MKAMVPLIFLLMLGSCAEQSQTAAGPPRGCEHADKVAPHVVRLFNGNRIASAIVSGPTELLTVRHVSQGLEIADDWQSVLIAQKDERSEDAWHSAQRLVRLKRTFPGSMEEEVHVLEMASPLDWNPHPTALRTMPLSHRDQVMGVGYTGGLFSSASGHFRTDGPASDARDEYVKFKMDYAPGARQLHGGSSGGGIFDCEGKLAALISRNLRSEYNWLGQLLFGSSNIYAVPVHPVAHEIAR